MRFAVTVLTGLAILGGAWAAAKDKSARRYQIEPNLEAYPQDQPKTALQSVIKAIEARKIDYLLAQLADPKFVDERVRLHGGNFEELVKETTRHLEDDPTLLKNLQRFVKDGEWEAGASSTSVFLKDDKDRRAFFRKIGSRWYLENEQTKKKKSSE